MEKMNKSNTTEKLQRIKTVDDLLDAAEQCRIGCRYADSGQNYDLGKAVYWFTKSAEQGNACAQYNLGICYQKGYGAAPDLGKAVYWLTAAAEQGYQHAKEALRGIKETETVFKFMKVAKPEESTQMLS